MISETIKGQLLKLESHPRLFSPKNVDKGTLHMLSFVEFEPRHKVLDLGCGYGAVGILAAKFCDPSQVFLVDTDKFAVDYAKKNAKINGVDGINVILSNAYENLDEAGFDLILSNPPYHTDFSVAKAFIEKGFNRLCLGGRFFMVTKRRKWYENKFISIFGGVKVYEKDGYFIFEAEKRGNSYAGNRRK